MCLKAFVRCSSFIFKGSWARYMRPKTWYSFISPDILICRDSNTAKSKNKKQKTSTRTREFLCDEISLCMKMCLFLTKKYRGRSKYNKFYHLEIFERYANIPNIFCLSKIRFWSVNPFECFHTRKSQPWTH